jgi:hypothetical protein
MDDANISEQHPVTCGVSDSAPDLERDRFQTLTEACSVMKDEIAGEAQNIIGGNELLGKPPTITEACSVIKERITSEAHQIISSQQPQVKPPTFTEACDSIKSEIADIARQIVPQAATEPPPTEISTDRGGDTPEKFASEDTDAHFYLHPIEQAQKAILEAQWFEQ